MCGSTRLRWARQVSQGPSCGCSQMVAEAGFILRESSSALTYLIVAAVANTAEDCSSWGLWASTWSLQHCDLRVSRLLRWQMKVLKAGIPREQDQSHDLFWPGFGSHSASLPLHFDGNKWVMRPEGNKTPSLHGRLARPHSSRAHGWEALTGASLENAIGHSTLITTSTSLLPSSTFSTFSVYIII